jgi:hypothetical protein
LAVGSDYVRIVITQVHVKDLDLLLRQYVPVIYGSLRFQLGSQRQTVTQVLDPRKDQYATRAGSLSVNRHLFKASPFIDPVIDMTIGVFRIKASDHTPAALRLLTSLSATVQPTLGVAVKFADTLTQGVLGLLEDRRSLVVGLNETFDDVNRLRPGYHVLIGAQGVDQRRFWMNADQLLYGEDRETAIPYGDADFIVYRVDGVPGRTDYWSVDGVREWYERALRSIQDADATALTEAYRTLMRVIAASVEFTVPDGQRIAVSIGRELQQRWTNQTTHLVQFKALDELPATQLASVSVEEYQAAINWRPRGSGGSTVTPPPSSRNACIRGVSPSSLPSPQITSMTRRCGAPSFESCSEPSRAKTERMHGT